VVRQPLPIKVGQVKHTLLGNSTCKIRYLDIDLREKLPSKAYFVRPTFIGSFCRRNKVINTVVPA
jgi:hypothetical protein